MNKPLIAIVVPCYNEEPDLPQSVPALLGVLEELEEQGKIAGESYVLCVDDGSTDGTWQVIKSLNKEKGSAVKGLSLAHNAGHQYALLAGLMEVKDKCDAAISIDADLQDDPRAIIGMVNEFLGGAEIVYGVRKSRATDTWFKRNTARAF